MQIEAKMFPELFPQGNGHYGFVCDYAERLCGRAPIRRADYVRVRLQQPRFSRSQPFIFYHLNQYRESIVDAGIYASTKIKRTVGKRTSCFPCL
jgi:hypothetical protein